MAGDHGGERTRAIATVAVVAAPSAVAAPTVTVDVVGDTFDGSCDDGDCSLRDAVAVVDPGGTVRVPPGFYALTLTGGGSSAGDVDLTRPVRIVGTGETGTFLDASGLDDRIFDVTADVSLHHLALLSGTTAGAGGLVRVRSGSLEATLSTFVFGTARDGGAIAVGGNGTAAISRSLVTANRASARGGGLYARGTATVSRSTISENDAPEGGGAFVSAFATSSIDDSTLSGNTAELGGGIHAEGSVRLLSSTVAANRASAGGGVSAPDGTEVSVTNTVFDGNRADTGGSARNRCRRAVTTSRTPAAAG